ncbi:MAG TPA: crosslink repair DNA glycosylase YcaQ family protein [Acidimicrobiia bacterium]|nr:crosslink repair DNA glycosylase YcaQ family protein [Acidimicrobiia bacterium]
MNSSPPRIGLKRARRLALAAQGFADRRPSGTPDVRHFRRVVRRVGVVQLDSVNVLARAHYLPFFSRLGAYDQAALDRWLWRSGELFEYWIHEASLTSIDRWAHLAYRMRRPHAWRSIERIGRERPGFVQQVLDEVRVAGPLRVGDLSEGGSRTGPWWGYGPGKHALEWLFVRGEVAIADRPNFTRLYDLTERVIAEPARACEADPHTARRVLLRDAVRHHGIGTVADLADYHRLKVTDARPVLAELAAAGEIAEVSVEGWPSPVYMDPELSVPRSISGAALLAPFDPVVWFRDRAERLFGFHYRIEIYVPRPRRVFGYYVLPFLLDGELVGRVDLKADRAGGRLLVQGAFAEQGQDRVRVGEALAEQLRSVAQWQGLTEIEIRRHGDLADHIPA